MLNPSELTAKSVLIISEGASGRTALGQLGRRDEAVADVDHRLYPDAEGRELAAEVIDVDV
jgi:hypothetical protein